MCVRKHELTQTCDIAGLGLSSSEVTALQESFGWRRTKDSAEQGGTDDAQADGQESSATPSDSQPPAAKRQRRHSPNEYQPSDLSDCEWEVDPETSQGGETTSTGMSSVLPSPVDHVFPEDEEEPAKPEIKVEAKQEQVPPRMTFDTPTIKSPSGFVPSPSPSPYADDYNMDYSSGGKSLVSSDLRC